MTLEDTIYYSCAAWASIHPNRAAALNHLFCVIGNGYEWQNGELVERCGMTTSRGKLLSMRAAINKAFRERLQRREEERKRRRADKRIAALRKKGKLFPGDQVELFEPVQPLDYSWDELAHKAHMGLEGVVAQTRPPRGHPVPHVAVRVSARDIGVDGKNTITLFLPVARLRLKQQPNAEWEKIRALIEQAVAAEKKLQETDPARHAEICAKRDADFKRQQKEWREQKRWDYRIPVDIAERIKDTAFNSWYPMCEYSRMVAFPDDIKPDWLEGIIETCRLIIDSPRPAKPSYFGREDKDGKMAAKQSKETVRAAINTLSHALSVQEWRRKHGWKAKLPKWLSRAKGAEA